MAAIDELPPYIYCKYKGCNLRHFLVINRDVRGDWTIGYIAFTKGYEQGIPFLCFNENPTIDYAARRLKRYLREYYETKSR